MRSGSEKYFTNAKAKIVSGREGKSEGLVVIRIGVAGLEGIDSIFTRAKQESLEVFPDKAVGMLGVRWTSEPLGSDQGGVIATRSPL